MRYATLRKPLFLSCFIFSLMIHVFVVYYFLIEPLIIEQSETTISKLQEELIIDKFETALEQSLTQLAVTPRASVSQDVAVEESEDLNELSLDYFPSAATLPPLFDPELNAELCDFALDDSLEPPLANEYEVENYTSVDLIEPILSADLARPSEDENEVVTLSSPLAIPRATSIEPSPMTGLNTLDIDAEIPEKDLFTSIPENSTPKLVLPTTVDYLREEWIKRSLADRVLPSLDHYGLEDVDLTEWQEEDIAIDVSYIPDPSGHKYIFSVTLHPEANAASETMRQNYYFLIDHQSSIDKQKFARFKRAAARCISAMEEGDTFNVIVFDKHVTRLFEKNEPVNEKTLKRAEEFLEKPDPKATFGSTELFTTLDRIMPLANKTDEAHSVILITDGNQLMNDNKKRQGMIDWIKKNRGMVNIYPASSGQDNDLVSLDMLTYGTAGKLLYSDTNASFPRKLVRLVKDLHHPIVRTVSVDAIPNDKNATITLRGGKNYFSPLFAGRPYTIIGTIDELCDFTLLIQGKRKESFFNVRKNISLKEATQGGRSLSKIWNTAKANVCYDKFLETGKVSYLKEVTIDP